VNGPTDPRLRRLERTAVTFCVAAAAVALGVRGGAPDVALGVLGGGLLIGVSYWAIKGATDSLLRLTARSVASAGRASGEAAAADGPATGEGTDEDAAGQSRRRAISAAWILVRLAGRYALLGFLAYAMIARLRLHPVGLLVGVSSIFAAAAVEALRQLAGLAGPGAGGRSPDGSS
jgi:hypothetical protein